MKKSRKVFYWIATGWLALGMLSTGIVQLLQRQEEKIAMAHLGFPDYILPLIGGWKLLGVVAILLPRFPLLKEWAYAGFFFAMSGACVSHAATGDGIQEYFGPGLLLVLTLLSWYWRPEARRVSLRHQSEQL